MTRIALLALTLAACASCAREEPAPAPATASPEAAATAPASAPAAAPTPTPAAPAASAPFDVGAFSGTFTGRGTTLELHADGTYALNGAEGASQGSWTHEAASNSIRLDPGSKTAEDQVLQLVDPNTLSDVGGARLTRIPAA